MEEGGHPFSTVRMEDPDLVKILDEKGIQYTAQLENTWFKTLLSWILPMLIFFGIWAYLMKRMGSGGGLMAIGKSKARVYVEMKDFEEAIDRTLGGLEKKSRLMNKNDYSENTAMKIDEEVAQLVTETYDKVKITLEEKKETLEKVAKVLMEKEVIEGDELRKLVA